MTENFFMAAAGIGIGALVFYVYQKIALSQGQVASSRSKQLQQAKVDAASLESFPASDAPGY